ncbi:MAG TPA: hypothetical protein VM450_12345 [Thermomicrobiales bacterium]|nr:hypothetical protein [Thermomicrobiales bacterium]
MTDRDPSDAIVDLCVVLNKASDVPLGKIFIPLAQEAYRIVQNDVQLDVSRAVSSMIHMFDGSDGYSDSSTEEMIRDWAKSRGIDLGEKA